MSMMKVDPKSNNLICRNCLERKPVQKQDSGIKAEQPKAQKQEEPMKEYFCKACSYNFKRAKHLVISTCPYCGSSATVISKGSTARIIADAARMKGD